MLDIPLYNQQVLFIFNLSDSEILSQVKRKKYIKNTEKALNDFLEPLISYSSTVGGRTVFYENGAICIRLYESADLTTIKGLCILMHEVIHACSYIFERIGMPHNQSTDEAYAYLYAHIMDRVFHEM